MIEQPKTSRISPAAWERMTDKQREECCAVVTNRELITRSVRDPGSLSAKDVADFGGDRDMVIEVLEIHETESHVALQSASCGFSRRRKNTERLHEKAVLAASGASSEYQKRMLEAIDGDVA